MKKLKLPPKPFNGLKIWCRKCRQNNTGCKHEDSKCYRANVINPITSKHSSKMLTALNYDDAVKQTIEFKKELQRKPSLRKKSEVQSIGNNYTLAEAILKFDLYLQADGEYKHLKNKVSRKHRTETIGYCVQFCESLKPKHNLNTYKPSDVSKGDVANFFVLMEEKYGNHAFNKSFTSLTSFFNFLIDVEDLLLKNHFKNCIRKPIPKGKSITITKSEFDKILSAIDTAPPKYKTTHKGRMDNVYYPWLKHAFRLFLHIGGRREEILNLRWSDVYETDQGTKLFIIRNLKVERMLKGEDVEMKYAPIGVDLMDLLIEMGYEQKKNTDDKLIDPENLFTNNTLKEKLSDAFTHYRRCAGIEKNFTLKHLRKTYLTWVKQTMGERTNKLSSHSSMQVLKDHYLDPTIIDAIEIAALNVKIFG